MPEQDQDSISFEFLDTWEDIDALHQEAKAIYEKLGSLQLRQELFVEELTRVNKRLREFYEKHREYFNLGD